MSPSLTSTIIVGRDEERRQLLVLLERAAHGQGSLLLISGEAGIGKTTLVGDLRRQARNRKLRILEGFAYDRSTAPPFGPWIEMTSAAAEFPEDLPRDVSLEDVHSTTALFRSVRDYFSAMAANRPLLVILEDLHWSDVASLELLRYLARQMSNQPVLFVATYREDELTAGNPFFQLLPLLVRESDVTRIALRPLGRVAIQALVERRYSLPPEERDRLSTYLGDRSEGNPFFIEELLVALQSNQTLKRTGDSWCLGDLNQHLVPALILQVIEGRLRALDPRTRDLLEAASVIGQNVSIELWASVTEAGQEEFSLAVELALSGRLLDETPGGIRLQFHHALVREALYQTMGPLKRRHWHLRTVNLLLEMPDPDPDDVVTHLQQLDDPRQIQWLITAGNRAASRFAWEAAVVRYERAAALLERSSDLDAEALCNVLLELGHAQEQAGSGRGDTYRGLTDAPDSRETYLRAIELARRFGLWEQLARAAIGRVGSTSWLPPPEVELLEEALNGLPLADSPLRAQVLARLAYEEWKREFYLDVPVSEASLRHINARFDEAVVMARRLDDPESLAFSLRMRAHGANDGDDLDARVSRCDELITLARATGDLSTEAHGQTLKYSVLLRQGNLQAAARVRQELIGLAGRLQMPYWEYCAAVYQAGAALSAGQYAEAERFVSLADQAWPRASVSTILLFVVRIEQDRVEEVLDRHQGMLTISMSIFPAKFWQVWEFLRLGRVEEAHKSFNQLADEAIRNLGRYMHAELGYGLQVATLLSELAFEFEDTDRAAILFDVLKPYHALNNYFIFAGRSRGAVAYYLGLLATTLSRWDDAEGHFQEAIQRNRKWGFRPYLAYSHYYFAEMLLKRNRSGDENQALDHIGQALDIAQDVGMVRLERLSSELLKQIGDPEEGRPAGLSPREVEVLQLVADGMTNAEVGEALFISPRTASQHVSNIYNKISVNNRAEATRWAIEHNIVSLDENGIVEDNG